MNPSVGLRGQVLTAATIVSAACLISSAPSEACTVWTEAGGKELHFKPGEPVVYFIQENGAADVDRDAAFEAIQLAFDAWSEVVCGEGEASLVFEFGGTIDVDPKNFSPSAFRDQKNMVTFINEDWPGNSGVVAMPRILWDSNTGEIIEFGIALNDEQLQWSTDPEGAADTFDIQSVMMRQIGLSFGLGDSTFEDSVMFPGFIEGDTSKRVMSNDDVAAVCDLYAPGREDFETTPEDAICDRDLHPGARNDPDPDPMPGMEPDPGPGQEPDPEPEVRMNLGPGENCLGPAECAEGLTCGCPLETCAANICFTPEDPEPAPSNGGKDSKSGCAQAPGTGSGGALFVLLGLLVWARRRLG